MSVVSEHQEIFRRGTAAPARALLTAGAVLAVLGLGFFVLLAVGEDPGRAWRMFHVNFLLNNW